jgi:hypothetical protein
MSGLKGGLLLCGLILSIALTAAVGQFCRLRAVQVLRIRILTASLADGARSTWATTPQFGKCHPFTQNRRFLPCVFRSLSRHLCARFSVCQSAVSGAQRRECDYFAPRRTRGTF